MEKDNQNPFAALLANPSGSGVGISKDLVEEIFLFTLRKAPSTSVALLNLDKLIVEDLDSGASMSEELLEHAIFERLMLTDTEQYLVSASRKKRDEALERGAIAYLHRAFVACEQLKSEDEQNLTDCEKIRKLIITNASTCIRQPDLFENQPIATQWLHILEHSNDTDSLTNEFLVQCVEKVFIEDEELEALGALKAVFYPLLSEIQKRAVSANLSTLNTNIFWILSYFVRDRRLSKLGEVLIDFTTPNPNAKGIEYMETLFGQLLAISILPKKSNGPPEFFRNVSLESQYTDPALWQLMSLHQKEVYSVMKQLLVMSATTKKKTLQWIASCLQANKSRGHLWSNIHLGQDQIINESASDAFMIGLAAVLLRLCTPLCEPTMKVLLVDPTYCGVTDEERQQKQVSMLKISEETCLIPTPEDSTRMTAEKYNFITEIFYMTHKAYELGYRACTEKYARLSREFINLRSAYQDIANTDPNNDMAKNLLRMLQDVIQQFLSLRNCLTEPENDSLILKFFEASAVWLLEITLLPKQAFENMLKVKDFAPHERRNKEIPTHINFIPSYLSSVPENIVDNIVAYLNFSPNFPPGQLIEIYQSSHDAFFKMIVLFMGSAELVKNPHLRAKLSEALEILLPKKTPGSTRNSILTHVFDNHEDRLKVVRSLLNVFVSIEMTGQSVQFEQKFNYRRPMYAIMEYLWTKEDQVQCFRDLAIEAEENMDAIEPPLFLRFINLLINDAIFLLDESLSNLQQIRQLQEAQANGEWNALSHNERQQQVSSLQHLGMLAKFDNILGRDTINILKLLTTEIKSIFCHNSMVDRIAAMLNYFLQNLVGPQKEKFNVKDKKKFEFDPAKTVLEICRIYINLSSSEKFCLAVSQDGRSYSSQLFVNAENILARIGGALLIGELADFAEKVHQIEQQYKKDQEYISDAPEEYLDPIMSTLMADPVILPSSKVTVDRTTIARHLLSDQTDPFNRSPLTMDMIKSNDDLRTEIEKWIADKRAGANLS